MKILSFFIFLLFTGNNPEAPIGIYNKWKLDKIETGKLILRPYKVQYYLQIDKDRIKYNLDVNSCGSNKFKIDASTIEFGMGACTEICCDGRRDSLYKYLNYSGDYILTDSSLTIKNKNGHFYLTKSL